jgi:hypothetical protein
MMSHVPSTNLELDAQLALTSWEADKGLQMITPGY